MRTRHALGRRTTMHWDVTGVIINYVGSDHSVRGGHLAGGGTEVRCIVGDVICFLFDSSREVKSDTRQVGEALCETSSSLPV